MNPNKFVTQAVDYQKSMVTSAFDLYESMQEQGQKWFETTVENSAVVPEGGNEIAEMWMDYVKQNQVVYRDYVESSLDQVKELFSEKKGKAGPSKAKASKKSD